MNDILGFTWDRLVVPRDVPTSSIARVCWRLHRMLPEFVWDAAVLEGNPFTFAEVKTLLDGITVGGRKVSDHEQVLNLADGHRRLLAMVRNGTFRLDKSVFCELNGLIARNEALEWGVFRGEGAERSCTPAVALGTHGRHEPIATEPGAPRLNLVFETGLCVLSRLPAFERALAFFLFGSLQQFFFDGNKRTSRLMMNGLLMSNGIDAISIPASRAHEFNQKMVNFCVTKDGTEMMEFLASCHPDADRIPSVQPGTNQDDEFRP
jgi:Fic family protein